MTGSSRFRNQPWLPRYLRYHLRPDTGANGLIDWDQLRREIELGVRGPNPYRRSLEERPESSESESEEDAIDVDTSESEWSEPECREEEASCNMHYSSDWDEDIVVDESKCEVMKKQHFILLFYLYILLFVFMTMKNI